MKTIRSKDGTPIAFDQTGQGTPLILVAGAFSFRNYSGLLELAELMSKHFTVINYDRRGRGDSGDTKPYIVEREIEDIEALIQEVGGSAYVWGLSSGAALALRAAASGLPIKKLILYEPPFRVEGVGAPPPPDFRKHLNELVAADRRGEAVKYFMTKGMGAPGFVVTIMRIMPGVWKRLKAVAHTLPYDVAIMEDNLVGKQFSADQWQAVTMPTLVMHGEKSPELLRRASEKLAAVLPNARQRVLAGQSHAVSMKVMAPVLVEFFGGE